MARITNGMTNGERVAYAHGRVKGDMDDIRATVEELHKSIRKAYLAWLSVLIGGLTILIIASIPFFALSAWTQYRFIYPVISIIVFTVARLISFNRILAVLNISHIIDDIVDSLANTQTLRIGFEHMQMENIHQEKHGQDGESKRETGGK